MFLKPLRSLYLYATIKSRGGNVFRKMRRFKQQISNEKCIKILKAEPRGVLALHGEDGYPYALPLNHLYYDGRLYFHCAAEGHKIDAIKADNKASFCVTDKGFRRENEWALNINSVIVFGKIGFVEDSAEKQKILTLLGNKYYPDPKDVDYEVEKYLEKVCILEMSIDHMTGKLVNES